MRFFYCFANYCTITVSVIELLICLADPDTVTTYLPGLMLGGTTKLNKVLVRKPGVIGPREAVLGK